MSTRGIIHRLGLGAAPTQHGYADHDMPLPEMQLLPIVLDAPLPDDCPGSRCDTLLTLPMGSGQMMDTLVSQMSSVSSGRITVVAPPGMKDHYEARLDGDTYRRVRIVDHDELTTILARCEATDHAILVDPRYWPTAGYDFVYIVAKARRYQGATHVLAVGADAAGTREQIEYDKQGRIRRVQRHYGPTRWPATAAATTFCSVAPGRILSEMTFDSLHDLRTCLSSRGMLSQDLPVLSDIDNLSSRAGILACSQRLLGLLLQNGAGAHFLQKTAGILIGEGCRIDASARMVPPLLIQDFVIIEAGAMLVGPAIIGAGSTIARRAVVAQSILLPGTQIPPGTTVSSHVGSADGSVAALAEMEIPSIESTTAADDLKACGWLNHAVKVQDLPRRHMIERTLKRTMDIALAGFGLLALSPLLITVGILVKLTSRGPLFFIHRREGRHGRPFGCMKFRTMGRDAHAKQKELYQKNQVDGPQFKMDNDPRVTSLGRILRATNVDELPQLLNVLAGHMSLVGPRPSPFRENQICVSWRRARLSVRPGITGLWQICRDRRCDGDFHQWIFYDITYVRHFSLWLDIKILFHTIISGGGKKRVAMSSLLPVEEHQETDANLAISTKA